VPGDERTARTILRMPIPQGNGGAIAFAGAPLDLGQGILDPFLMQLLRRFRELLLGHDFRCRVRGLEQSFCRRRDECIG